jgi:hypothetical protein
VNINLLNVVKRIIANNGETVLADPRRLKAFFGDLAKDEPKPPQTAFGRCIEVGAYNALKIAPDAAERAERKTAIAPGKADAGGKLRPQRLGVIRHAWECMGVVLGLVRELSEGSADRPHGGGL